MSERQWFMDQIYNQCVKALDLLATDWPFGALTWAKEKHPELYARLKEIEEGINSSFKGDLQREQYMKTTQDIGVYTSILEEVKLLFNEARG